MSESATDPLETTDPSQPAMDQILQDNIKTPRRWMGLRLAQTAGLVQDALEMTAFARQKEREAWELQKSILGIPLTNAAKSTNEQQPSGDEVGNINVGDTHYHLSSTAQQANAMGSDGKATTTSKPSTLGTVAKWGAIAATVAGSGIGGSLLTAYLLKPAAPAVQDPTAYTNDGEIFEIK